MRNRDRDREQWRRELDREMLAMLRDIPTETPSASKQLGLPELVATNTLVPPSESGGGFHVPYEDVAHDYNVEPVPPIDEDLLYEQKLLDQEMEPMPLPTSLPEKQSVGEPDYVPADRGIATVDEAPDGLVKKLKSVTGKRDVTKELEALDVAPGYESDLVKEKAKARGFEKFAKENPDVALNPGTQMLMEEMARNPDQKLPEGPAALKRNLELYVEDYYKQQKAYADDLRNKLKKAEQDDSFRWDAVDWGGISNLADRYSGTLVGTGKLGGEGGRKEGAAGLSQQEELDKLQGQLQAAEKEGMGFAQKDYANILAAQIAADKAKSEAGNNVFKQTQGLRKEFNALPGVKAARVAKMSLGRMNSVVNRLKNLPKDSPQGPSDIALVFSFMKTFDPESVVRESEYGLAAKSAGMPKRFLNIVNKVLNGAQLDPGQRDEFLGVATANVRGAEASIGNQLAVFKREANEIGVDPDRVVSFDMTAEMESQEQRIKRLQERVAAIRKKKKK